jgi:dephospho-CoA kinase
MRNKILQVVLTGTIGSGKTTVAKYFADLGIKVIDSDLIVRDLLSNNQKVMAKIQQYFGVEDRKILREIIFNDPEQKKWLEELLHPLVFKEIVKQVAKIETGYCLIIIPLFLETRNRYKIGDRVLVVTAPREQQIARTTQRDNTTVEMAQKILEQQADTQKLLACADDIIINDKSLNELKKQVEKLHEKYQNISKRMELSDESQ